MHFRHDLTRLDDLNQVTAEPETNHKDSDDVNNGILYLKGEKCLNVIRIFYSSITKKRLG
jgi:hypothetical protein